MAAAELEVVEEVAVVVDIAAHLGDHLTVNWHWRFIGLLCGKKLVVSICFGITLSGCVSYKSVATESTNHRRRIQ